MHKNKFDTLLFDLDGTIIESAPGVTRAFSYALSKYGIAEDPKDLSMVIGPPLDRSFIDFFGFTPDTAAEAIEHYREYYRARGIFECEIYDGIPETLDALSQRGARILLATSKPAVFATQILEHFGLSRYFCHMVGSELDGRRTAKVEVIKYALELSESDPHGALMVGDRSFDIVGAHAAGVSAAGVLWGYGSADELSDAEYLIDTPSALLDAIEIG